MSVFVISGENRQLRDFKINEKEVVGSVSRHQPSDEEEEEEEDGWEEDDEGWEGGDQDSIWTPGRGGATKRPPEEGFTRSLRKASGAGGGTGAKRCKRRSASLGSGNQASGTGAGRPHTTAHRASHHHLPHPSSDHCADSQTVSPGHHRPMEQEKRIRREIANSNERRRMQSINAGFQSLRTLLPHHEGEKLSKAAILQQTAEYIYQLEQEKTRLLSQNSQLKRLVNQHEGEASSAKKRKLEPGAAICASESSSADEGIGSMSPEPPEDAATNGPEMLRREMIDLRMQLDRERRRRMHLEDQVRSLEAQLYPGRIREITQQVQMQYQRTGPADAPLEGHQESVCVKAETSPMRTASSPPPSNIILLPPPSPIPPQQPPTIHLLHSSPPVSPRLPKEEEAVEDISEDALRLTPSDAREHSSPTPPPPEAPGLPSALESAIKAEPKVEVEMAPRIPSPAMHTADVHEERDEAGLTPQTRLYLGTTSRQNLETIVEAIRHLEGDHLFGDDPPHHHHHLHHLHHHHHLQEVQIRPESPQDVPLALTTQVMGPPSPGALPVEEHLAQDYSPHLHAPHHLSTLTPHPPAREEEEVAVDLGCYRPPSGATSVLALAPPTSSRSSPSPPHLQHHFELHPMGPLHRRHPLPPHTQQQQQRPGVIVVKHT